MKKSLKNIAPLQLGKVLGALYGCVSLIIVPFVILAAFVMPKGDHGSAFPGLLFLIFIPVIYAIIGFVGGIITAAIYNLLASFTGGIHFTVEDVPPA